MKEFLRYAAWGVFLLAIWHQPAGAGTRTISTTGDFSAGNLVNVLVSAEGDGAVVLSPAAVPGAWEACPALPAAVSHHAAAYYAGRIYCIGGRQGAGGEFLRDVYVSTIGPGGLPGSWSATTPLPEGRAFHAAAAYNGYVYVVGGDKPGFEVTPEVLYARIEADGQLGPWNSTSPLPDEAGRDLAGLAVAYGRMYLVAGAPNGGFYGTDTVYSAPIRPDGSLGTWEEDRSLPVDAARLGAPALFASGRLYLVGGNAPILDSADSPLNSVWTAEVTPDSKLGAWTTTNEIVVPIRDTQGNTVGSRQEPRFYTGNSSVAAGGHLVLVGGHAVPEGADQPTPVQSVLVGRLLPNGDVDGWDYAAPYPFRVSRCAAVLAGDRVVVLGGRDSAGDDRADVYAAPLVAVTPQSVVTSGLYESAVLDLGARSTVQSIQWEAVGSASVKLRYRLADENGAWGKWSSPSDARSIPVLATARYVQFAAEFTGDGKTSASLTSVAVSYTVEKPVVYGDITGDGKVTLADASEAARIAVRAREATAEQLRAGDVAPKPGRGPRAGEAFGDGVVNILDVSRILRAALGLIPQLP